jgi:hypothetical protein
MVREKRFSLFASALSHSSLWISSDAVLIADDVVVWSVDVII